MAVGNAGKDVCEPNFRIDAVELGRADQSVDRRGPLAAGVRAGEEIVLAAKGGAAQGVLGDVVVGLQPAVVEETGERNAALERVAERLVGPAWPHDAN